MNYAESRQRKLYKKYHESDIFNTRTEPNINKTYRPPIHKTTQPSLEKTKSDIFNTKGKSTEPSKANPQKKRNLHLKNYKSDIFNIKSDLRDRAKSCKRININHSTCFDGIKNDEEYKKDLNKYTVKHRPKQKKYEVEKYFNKESAISRYYKELYGDEKSGVFPDKTKINKTGKNSPSKNIINTFKNNMKIFENRKKKLKRELTEINDVGADGKRRPGEHSGQEIDSKGNKIKYNKKKVDIYGNNIDNKNNKKIIKENNGFNYNSKMNKQLEFQSNIFNEENKDINKKMNDYISGKKKEEENKKILKEKIKKEREEMAKKLKELNKQNIKKQNDKLHPSTMKWTDPESQILFKKPLGDLNNNQEEPSAFQMKLKNLADSNNIDILSKNKKKPFNIKKIKNLNDDDNNIQKIKEIIKKFPDDALREDQKIGIIYKSTTSNFLNNSKNDEKLNKYYNTINTNIKSARQSKSKKKNDSIIKIMGKNSKKEKTNKSTNKSEKEKVHNYTLVYSTKHNHNIFDRFGNDDIKRIFVSKGLHIFDVKKNELVVGDLNSFKFKVRENDEENEKNIEEKIKFVENDLIKNKFKVSINKDEIKKITKDNRNLKEKEMKEKEKEKGKGKFNKTPYKQKGIKSFTNQFPKVDLKYKNFHKE